VTKARWVGVAGAACFGLLSLIGVAIGPVTGGAGATQLAVPTAGPGLLPYPIDIPVGPQASAADCPNPPALSAPLPSGASISAPQLTPAGSGSVTADGTTYDATGTCEYTIEYPSSANHASGDSISVTYAQSGSDYYFPTGTAGGITFTWGGQSCVTTAEIVTAYGLAIAEQELDSGGCNTDSSGVWGYADAIDTAEQTAAPTSETTFHSYYQSHESGTIFYGQFQECLESPAGQHSTYVCSWNNFGPLF
jgi:hypothetical protein